MSVKHRDTMIRYLDAFNDGDLESLLSLFSEQALVYSPTQPEPKAPQDFYPALLERSKGTKFKLKAVFEGEQPNIAAMLFDYNKAMPDGSIVTFDCVDVCLFDENGKIEEMRIIFDTKKLGL